MLQNASVLCSLWSPNNTLLYRYVIYSSIDGHLRHSSLGAIINNSPGNICVQVFAWTYSFIKECSWGSLLFCFYFYPPEGPHRFPVPLTVCGSSWSILVRLRWYLTLMLIGVSLVICDGNAHMLMSCESLLNVPWSLCLDSLPTQKLSYWLTCFSPAEL